MNYSRFVLLALFLFSSVAAEAQAPAVDRVLPSVVKVKATSTATVNLNDILIDASDKGNAWKVMTDKGTYHNLVDPVAANRIRTWIATPDTSKLEARVAAAQKRVQSAKKKGRRSLCAAQKEYDQANRELQAARLKRERSLYLDLTGTIPSNADLLTTDRLHDIVAAPSEGIYLSRGDGLFTVIVSDGANKETEGTGFVWRADGYIVTGSIVIDDATKFEVTLPSGQTLEAKLMVNDTVSGIAVLKVDARDLPAITSGDSQRLRPGESVFAVGNTEGFTNTLLTGIVSGLDRELTLNDQRVDALIQTNIVLPQGFAGGPLVNARGEVIGVNFATYKPATEGSVATFSFALPMHEVREIVDEIIEKGKIERAFLGVKVNNLDDAKRSLLKLPDRKGVTVEAVYEESPAAKAGIIVGDVILKVDDHVVVAHTDVPRALRHRKPGDRVVLELWRDGGTQRIEIVSGTQPPELIEMSKKSDRFSVLLQQLLERNQTDDQVVEALHLATLGRLPNEDERKTSKDQIAQLTKQKERASAFEDYLFALTHSPDFFAHIDDLNRHDLRRQAFQKESQRYWNREALEKWMLFPRAGISYEQALTLSKSGAVYLSRVPAPVAADQSSPPSAKLLSGHDGIVLGLAASPDGNSIASIGSDRTVRLWDRESGAEIRTMTGHAGTGFAVAFSPDGKLIASGGVDRVRIWDTHTGSEIRRLSGQASPVRALAFSNDGTLLASGSDDHSIWLFDAHTGDVRATLSGHTGYVMGVAFSPDGKLVASCSTDRTIRLWDAQSGSALRTMASPDVVRTLAFSPDGTTLISGGDDKTLQSWDAKTGSLIWKSEGHERSVVAVLYFPDGKTIATGSYDGSVRLWDARTGALMRITSSGADKVSSVAISPDGRLLVIGSPDGKIRVWDVSAGK